MAYGASPEEWAHLDLVLGLTADLLPVVSNPAAPISPNSKMKGVGKTPSMYNQARQVVGVADWTQRQSTSRDIERWMKEPDYGICIQTRHLRALDIDVDDEEKAGEIAVRAAQLLCEQGEQLRLRYRSNSGKKLLAFYVEGDLYKRSFKCDGGLVEFLATGQQFVAVGTHTSGTRYEWAGGLPHDFPTISEHNFERMWRVLCQEFAIEPPASAQARKRGDDLGIGDPVVDWLEEKWETFGYGGQGQLFVTCPWKDGHSSDSGETEAAWFPAGTGGYAQGHFKCLHASCANRADEDFLDAVGYRVEAFECLPVVSQEGKPLPPPLPPFDRDKQGRIEATAANVQMALQRPDITGVVLGYDAFRDDLLAQWDGSGRWAVFKNTDFFEVRLRLERGNFKPLGREMVRDAIHHAAEQNMFDSAIEWLTAQQWDGVPRVERFLADYFGADDTPYTRAVSTYMWSALAGRALSPGVKCDMVPVFVGGQGIGKSTGVAALAPTADQFVEFDLGEKEEDKARKMRGKLVGEISELRGLQTRDIESIKAFVTRTHEEWVPKYQERKQVFPRRLVLFGTTNQEEFLADETGNRRWLPVVVKRNVDTDRIANDRSQLWAEARELFKRGGVVWSAASALAPEVQSAHIVGDAWEDAISKWLRETDITGDAPAAREFLRTSEIASGALGLDMRHISKREEMRIARALRALGYERARFRGDGRVIRAWKFTSCDLV